MSINSYELIEIQNRQRKAGYSNARLTQWFLPKNTPTGVFICIHGLNVQPNKMHDLIKILNDRDQMVLNVSLRGHGENFNEFFQVTADHWQEDFQQSYSVALAKAKELNLQLGLLGFSTGGPVSAVAQLENPNIKFDRVIYLAPAFKIRKIPNLIRYILWLKPLSIKSMNHKDYRAHPRSPIAAYKALINSIDQFKHLAGREIKSLNNLLRQRTLLIFDPKDELVDVRSIQTFITNKPSTAWEVFMVDASSARGKSLAPHHSVFNEFYMGPTQWKLLNTKLTNFLNHSHA